LENHASGTHGVLDKHNQSNNQKPSFEIAPTGIPLTTGGST
jgi:hypothetical protein